MQPGPPVAAELSARTFVSIISPAYNEAKNLPVMYERLLKVMDGVDADWEWIVIDDHSQDTTYAVICDLARRDPRVRGARFARNFGSHKALTYGIRNAVGQCCVGLAADLQDPPETIPELLEHWREGAHVVWAVRSRRDGESASTILFSRIYRWMMRRIAGLAEMTATGADFFLLDRAVIDAFKQFRETNVSMLALVAWMGFRQVRVPYDKQARLHGRSGWNMRKKLKLVVDSLTSFTYLPIRLMAYVGFLVASLGFIYAVFLVGKFIIAGSPAEGWTSLMVVLLIVSGFQMVMMGVLGEYLWRALDESRRRPAFIVEARTDGAGTKERD